MTQDNTNKFARSLLFHSPEECQSRKGRRWNMSRRELSEYAAARRIHSPEELTVPRRTALERSGRESLSENVSFGPRNHHIHHHRVPELQSWYRGGKEGDSNIPSFAVTYRLSAKRSSRMLFSRCLREPRYCPCQTLVLHLDCRCSTTCT